MPIRSLTSSLKYNHHKTRSYLYLIETKENTICNPLINTHNLILNISSIQSNISIKPINSFQKKLHLNNTILRQHSFTIATSSSTSRSRSKSFILKDLLNIINCFNSRSISCSSSHSEKTNQIKSNTITNRHNAEYWKQWWQNWHLTT